MPAAVLLAVLVALPAGCDRPSASQATDAASPAASRSAGAGTGPDGAGVTPSGAGALAIGMGFLAAQLFLKAQMDYTLTAPGVGFYAIVIVGLAACLAIIASTLPLLERITGPETARSE